MLIRTDLQEDRKPQESCVDAFPSEYTSVGNTIKCKISDSFECRTKDVRKPTVSREDRGLY